MLDRIDDGAFGRSIPDRFEKQVERHADRIAFDDSDGAVTYAGLNARANELAHAILEARGDAEEGVGLYLDQGLSQAVALLGSLKAGKFYVPMDPTFPAERCRRMLRDAGCTLVITDARHFDAAAAIAGPDRRVIACDGFDGASGAPNPNLELAPERKAYVIFTSGSTGEPKGVAQWHGSILHNTALFARQFNIVPKDRHTQLYRPGVYGAARDTFCALLNGAALCHYALYDRGIAGLGDWIESKQISIYASVATVFRRMLQNLPPDRRFEGVRLTKLGGEGILWRDVDACRRHFGEACRISCGLAMTEAGAVTQMFVDETMPRNGLWVPLGEAVEDKELLLLDEQGRVVDGVGKGEIAVRSRYLALGYIGRDDLTERAFLTDPDDPSRRIYRTGDMGERFADGRVEYQGRRDFQVKIMGYRVDISEIEVALLDLEPVKEAVVMAHEPAPGERQLAAYVTLRDGHAAGETILRAQLRKRLPSHMVPAHILVLPELPQTASGKIDRQKLPSPTARDRDAAVAPRNVLEEELRTMWESALGVSGIGIDDDFFDLGGDSLRATQLLLEANERFDVSMIAESIFGPASTIAGMAVEIERAGGKACEPADIGGGPYTAETVPEDAAVPRRTVDIDFVEFDAARDVASKSEMIQTDPVTGLRRARPNVVLGAVRTNALGFRGPQIEPMKPAGTIRLAFLGSSGTFDRWVSSNDAAWPHRVCAGLRIALPDLRFDYVNAGLPGYNTRHMTRVFEDHVASLEPDVVLIRGTDMYADTAYLAREEGVYQGVHIKPSLLARRSRLWGKIEQNLVIAWRLFAVHSSRGKLQLEPDRLTLGFRKRLEHLVAECRDRAPVVVIVAGGARLSRRQSWWVRLRASITHVYYMPYLTIEGIIDAQEQYQRVQREVAERTGCVWIDVADAVPADGSHFVDSNHFSDAGSLRMAKAVTEGLLADPAFRRFVAARRQPAPHAMVDRVAEG